ncbi:hypothetical protein BY996DRAFT_6601536 [Phakopsora pachyrhizi]|nr:hypothetical protein BY996DRAFT_6601536 [Phakopsora pachyrhizi]
MTGRIEPTDSRRSINTRLHASTALDVGMYALRQQVGKSKKCEEDQKYGEILPSKLMDMSIRTAGVPTDEIPITTNNEILGIRIQLKVAASVEEKDALELALFAENEGENKNNGSRSQSHVAKAVTHSMAREFLTNNVEPQEVQNTQETQIVIEAPQEDAQESEMNIRQYKLFPTVCANWETGASIDSELKRRALPTNKNNC